MERITRNACTLTALWLSILPFSNALGSHLPPNGPNLKLTVHAYDHAQIPRQRLGRAQEIAQAIFEPAGISLIWFSCEIPVSPAKRRVDCPKLQSPRGLHLHIVPHPAPGASQFDRMAGRAIIPKSGFPFTASVFFDKVEDLSFEYRSDTGGLVSVLPTRSLQSAILAVVMAHEIGHLLLGRNSHSQDGVMGRFLDRSVIAGAYQGRLQFSPAEAARLRLEVMARTLAADGFRGILDQAPGILECDLLASPRESALAPPADSR